MPFDILHDSDACKFYVLADGREAHLLYAVRDERTLDFRHTFVPPELRGRGIAEDLVKRAFAYARERGSLVIPTCSYVARLAAANPEYGKLTVP